MGKKSKRRNGNEAQTTTTTTTTTTTSTTSVNPYPHSDGPSEEDLSHIQTDSPSLQQKLDQLTALANANNRSEFVSQFVPLDLTQEDTKGFLDDLTIAPEAEGQWNHLVEEIRALAKGKGVTKIEGDQKSKAIFILSIRR